MSKKLLIASVLIAGTLLVGIAVWALSPVPHLALGQSQREFALECDFAKFRQIMVRLNATDAIVNHGGMTLLNESVNDVAIDTSKDDRPLLNAILGKSKAELDAVKTITVRVADDQVDIDELTLRQTADIDEDQMLVTTASIGPQGAMKNYETTLFATADGNRTSVRLTLDMQIEVQVPKLFTSRADAGVAEATEKAITGQQQAITEFIISNAGKNLILPELK
ncbi:hypothetical protein K227x_37070 [Rubripirellula lacrimiformis]|uniref:Uncharacterized protein n=1 Tax=Rubripirellula lacrimiformis TaxID=1930273 RepID=A0A517NDV1_9BACT|nr:hypothetical protein [Rubripirellula lacrimiformis]QDT05307.1 hypothetical protein K227x_37070 [Rubripirellula lacrimiformis]